MVERDNTRAEVRDLTILKLRSMSEIGDKIQKRSDVGGPMNNDSLWMKSM